jgi:hypothetical protein
MPNVKGTAVVGLKKIFKESDPACEVEFFRRIGAEMAATYKMMLPSSWYPIELMTTIYENAALVLYAGQAKPKRQLGHAMASHTYSTIYKLLLRIPSAQFVVSRAAQIWDSFYDKGQVTIENFNSKTGGDMVVREFPELNDTFRDLVCGHLVYLMESNGIKNIKAAIDDTDPQAWRWSLTWPAQ